MSHRCLNNCTTSNNVNDKYLTEKVEQLSIDLNELKKITLKNMKQNLSKCQTNPVNNTVSPPSTPASPPAPDVVLVIEDDQESPSSLDHHDTSALSDSNTIDDNVPDIPASESLNYHVKTTQLNQLKHTRSASLQ